MFKYLIQLLFVGLLFLNFGLDAQDSTGTIIQSKPIRNQDIQVQENPVVYQAETNSIENKIVLKAPKTTAQIKINQAPSEETLANLSQSNPFALVRNGEPRQSKSIAMFSTSSKKSTLIQKEVEALEIEDEPIIDVVFEPVDTSTSALNNQNPFRLEGSETDREQVVKAMKIKFNPNAGTGVKNTKEKSKPLFDTSKVDVNQSDTLKFTLLTLLLGILAFIVARFRSELAGVYQAFLSQNLMSLLYREKETIFSLPYLSMYLLSVISIGTSIFLVLNLFEITPFENPNSTVLASITGVAGFFIFKHSILTLLSILFPFRKEINLYSFTIAIFNFIIGIALLPFVALLAFADSSLHNYVLYTMLFLVGIVLIYRFFRSILIGQKYLINSKFHFFMYLCTVEIAPIVILFKFLS